MYYFTGDEHFGHARILGFCDRPFDDVHEMNVELTRRHNEVVTDDDTVIHAGDFTLQRNAQQYIQKLRGKHIFVRGSHDKWMDDSYHERWEQSFGKQHVVVDHYAGFTWPKSHYNSWQLFGHSHGGLEGHPLFPFGKQWDVGVDNNNFYPVSFDQICRIMASRPNNWNLVQKKNNKNRKK